MDTVAREVLNVEQAAEFLGFSAYTVREKARAGEIPGRKVGREWRFFRQELLRWLKGDEKPKSQGHVVELTWDSEKGWYWATVQGVPDILGRGKTADEAVQDVYVELERASYAPKYRQEMPPGDR